LVYSQLGKDDQAVEACATAIKRAPALLDGYQTLFYIQLRRGRPNRRLLKKARLIRTRWRS
jgi:hypothetical protein